MKKIFAFHKTNPLRRSQWINSTLARGFFYQRNIFLMSKAFLNSRLCSAIFPLPFKENQNTGRPKTPFLSSLKCFIYMSISIVKNLSELRRILLNNPSLCLKCGFDPLHLPPVERFSSFLRDTPSIFFKRIETQLARELVDCGVVSGRYLTLDTCSVPIQCKENNLKTSSRE